MATEAMRLTVFGKKLSRYTAYCLFSPVVPLNGQLMFYLNWVGKCRAHLLSCSRNFRSWHLRFNLSEISRGISPPFVNQAMRPIFHDCFVTEDTSDIIGRSRLIGLLKFLLAFQNSICRSFPGIGTCRV